MIIIMQENQDKNKYNFYKIKYNNLVNKNKN